MNDLYSKMLKTENIKIEDDIPSVYNSMTRYLLNIDDFNTLRKILKKNYISPKQIKYIKFRLLNQHEIAANLKHTIILAKARATRYGKVNLNNIFLENELTSDDVIIYKYLTLKDRKDIDKKIEEIPEDYVYGVHHWRRQCDKMIKELNTKIIRFAHRRLRFIATSNNYKMDDMIHDLLCKAVESFYRIAPYREGNYLSNTVISSVYNQGIKEINKNTTQKKGRLKQDDEGSFYNVIQSYNNTEDGGENNEIMNRAADSSEFKKMERKLAINSLLKEHDVYESRFIEIITSEYDAKFDKFCIEKLKRSSDDLLKYNGKAYLQNAAVYCKLPLEQAILVFNTTHRRLNQ